MLTYGFFNSVNSDRQYDAEQMSSIFDGVIADGVYMDIGDHFAVTAEGSSMTVYVGSGRAWFDHTWTLNDASYEITLDDAETIQDRIDAVVLDVDHRPAYRKNQIIIVKGSRSSNPSRPALIKEEYHKQYALAYIRVGAGVTRIRQSNITNNVGTSACPFVTGIIDTIDIDSLVANWEVEWDEKLADETENFNDWVAGLKDKLDDETAGHLQNELTWTKYAVLASGWSDTTVSNLGDGNTYYTYDISVNSVYVDVPQIERATSSSDVYVQTEDEASAYAMIVPPSGWAVLDTTAKRLTLYAKVKPTETFYIKVQGVA